MNVKFLITPLLIFIFVSCKSQDKEVEENKYPISKTEEEWKKILSPEEYEVLRKKGTERAFSGAYNDHHEEGFYLCNACKNKVFHSSSKFESDSGWPSFFKPVENQIKLINDRSYGMVREEVVCANCGSHLGHVFEDGPKPTGLRYCLNSVALDFKKE